MQGPCKHPQGVSTPSAGFMDAVSIFVIAISSLGMVFLIFLLAISACRKRKDKGKD